MVVVVLFQYIVQLVPPMELHILLGLGNDLLKVLKESMVAMGWEPTLQRWMTAIDVKQSKHYGGQFTGNRMKRVLNCLRVSIFSLSGLYLAGRDFSKSQKCRMFCIEAIEAMENVRKACFGQTLDDHFESEIRILGRL